MLKVSDKCDMSAEEIKQELMSQWDEYRMGFDRVFNATDLDDEQKYKSCHYTVGCMSAIMDFLTKIGVEIRDEETGAMAYNAYPFSTFSRMQDLEMQMRKKYGAE